MDTSNLSADFTSALEPELQDISVFAENLERSRRAVWASVAKNEEERAAIAEAEDNFEYTMILNGSNIQLVRNEKDDLIVEDLLQNGKDIPHTGGTAGFVSHLDGTKTKSKVPFALQGKPLPQFAWDPQPVTEETATILTDTVPEMVNDIASNSSAGAETIKQYIVSNLHLGGSL